MPNVKTNTSAPGFDVVPQGKLLTQIIVPDTPMGLAYERAIGFDKESHVHGRHMLVCPRGSCRMEITETATGTKWKVDSTRVLWVPSAIAHRDEGTSAIYDTLALYPSETYFTDMAQDNGLSAADVRRLETNIILLKRSRWLNDILDRYFFERILNRHTPPGCTFFLEKQITNEVARLAFQDRVNQIWGEREADGASPDPLDRAIHFIESRLFDGITLSEISRAAAISESTLTRRFRTTLKLTPYDYIKSRRLDEALILIQQGDHPIGDVSLLVGYEDFSAFSRAFRQRFKKPPSAFAKTTTQAE